MGFVECDSDQVVLEMDFNLGRLCQIFLVGGHAEDLKFGADSAPENPNTKPIISTQKTTATDNGNSRSTYFKYTGSGLSDAGTNTVTTVTTPIFLLV